MSSWESWVIGISVAGVAIAFAILVIFIIRTLLSLERSLRDTGQLIRDTNDLVLDVEKKLHSFDPLFTTVANLTSLLEKRATSADPSEERQQKVERTAKTALEVIEWALVGYTLWQKLKERK